MPFQNKESSVAKIIIEYEKDQDAGYDGNHKPVKTIDDILDLMEEGAKRAE